MLQAASEQVGQLPRTLKVTGVIRNVVLMISFSTVASHECLGRSAAVGTWVVVVIVHGKSTNQSIYW